MSNIVDDINLKIENTIVENGNKSITANVLKSILLDMTAAIEAASKTGSGGGSSSGGSSDGSGMGYYIFPLEFTEDLFAKMSSSSSEMAVLDYQFPPDEWDTFMNSVYNLRTTEFIVDMWPVIGAESGYGDEGSFVGMTLMKGYMPEYSDGMGAVMFYLFLLEAVVVVKVMINNSTGAHTIMIQLGN